MVKTAADQTQSWRWTTYSTLCSYSNKAPGNPLGSHCKVQLPTKAVMDSLISPEVVLVSVFGSRCNLSPPALSVPKANFQVSHWASVNKVSLFAKFHAQTNGQTKTANQALCGPIKPAYVEYPAGLARVGTQLQMFSVCIPSKCCAPSIQHHLHCCCCLWRDTKTAFLRMQEQNKHQADCHQISGPNYSPGQKVWLSDKNILTKRAESIKLSLN